MQRFVAKQNIQHFKEMLAAEADPARRVLLERMIAEEEAKLKPPPAAGARPGEAQASAEVDSAQQQADLAVTPKR